MSRPANPNPNTNPNPTALFVANLRLLDLDLRDDWPALSVDALSARHADQKQRIAGVEWALFRLYELWDPTETAQKLRPFFPPLEPLQSLNLRAALFRCLNELKKNGVLGRDAVLRKTMLDECKGERFFELLALFSAAVLRKVLAGRGSRSRSRSSNNKSTTTSAAITRTLATASTLTPDAQRSLLPLAVAHKAALANVLRRKDEKRRTFAHFAAVLDSKADAIAARTRRCIDTPRATIPAVSRRDADALKRQLADHWIGDQKWLAVMLHGDHTEPGDAFLTTRFDKVWHMVERGREFQNAAPDAGLLQDLQARLDDQQTRLHKWKAFHDELRRQKTSGVQVESTPLLTKREFNFNTHTQHQLPVAKAEAGELRHVHRPPLRSSYQHVLSDMDAELARVLEARPQPKMALRRRMSFSKQATKQPLTQTIQPSTKQPLTQTIHPSTKPTIKHTVKQTVQQMIEHTAPTLKQPAWHPEPKSLVSEPKTLVREQKALFEGLAAANAYVPLQRRPSGKATPLHPDPPRAASSSPLPSEDSAPSQPTPASEHSPSPSPPPSPPFARFIPALNPEDLLADQIISAIGNATPSPVKKPQPRMSMSLVDRTRMTLSRTPSFDPVLESPDPLPTLPTTLLANDTAETSTTQSLLERTRQSMAMSRASSVKQRPARQKRDSESSFPTNHFDAPRANTTLTVLDEGGSGTKTPREDLLDADVDYDRVFKSRPRIATSPIFSPQKFHGEQYQDENSYDETSYDEDVTGIDLGDVDGSDGEDGFTQTLDASPSKRRGVY